MKMRHVMLAVCLLFTATLFAQKKPTKTTTKEEPKEEAPAASNLVPDPSFEKGDVKGLKATGQLTTFCKDWTTPNKTSADLYHKDAKGDKCSAPNNLSGSQEPMNDGSAYAGVRAFTKDPKKTRTYIQVKLNQKLEKDKIYCVKFNVSLAECSKFGVNNVGAFFSDRKIQNQDDKALTFTPQILEKTNKSLVTMDGWETICGTLIATGREEYLIIGGFGTEDQMKQAKVKKPSGSTVMQGNEAYYYIDEIEVVKVEAASQCVCGKADQLQPDLIYSRASSKTPDMKPEQVINNTAAYFAFLSYELPEQFKSELDEVATLLKANPSLRIELTGHADDDEMNEAKLNPRNADMGQKRADAILKYLTEKGVDASRMSVVNKNNESPANTKPTPIAKAQNRRVELKVK